MSTTIADSEMSRVVGVRAALNAELRGKQDVIELVLAGLLARGHLLIEDKPGLGKTTLAKALARAVGGQFARVQCTPDLLPGDITGFNVFNQKSREFDFLRGPVFADVLLADEINRTTPRTQSALLEAMAERQVTVDNVRYPLSETFFVLATQNPVEHHGTYPLPEAQFDRFAMKLHIGYPGREDELSMLEAAVERTPPPAPPRSGEGSQNERTPPPAPPRSGEGSQNEEPLPTPPSPKRRGEPDCLSPLSAWGRGSGGGVLRGPGGGVLRGSGGGVLRRPGGGVHPHPLTPSHLEELQDRATAVSVSPAVRGYLVDLAHATRRLPRVSLGVSPRGLLTWQRVAQAWAFLRGRPFVTPDDVQAVAGPVLSVRLGMESGTAGIIEELLASVKVPVYPREVIG